MGWDGGMLGGSADIIFQSKNGFIVNHPVRWPTIPIWSSVLP
jgi:hypothetical protein